MSLKLLKKETLAQMFSCEFCEISKNTFFTEHLWTTASINWTMTRNQVFIKANNPISTKFAVKRTRRRRNFSIAKPHFSCMSTKNSFLLWRKTEIAIVIFILGNILSHIAMLCLYVIFVHRQFLNNYLLLFITDFLIPLDFPTDKR